MRWLAPILLAAVACGSEAGAPALDGSVSDELDVAPDPAPDSYEVSVPDDGWLDLHGDEASSDDSSLVETLPEIRCCCICPDGSALRKTQEDDCQIESLPTPKCDGECLDFCPETNLPSCTTLSKPSFAICVSRYEDPDYTYRTEPILLSGVVEAIGSGPLEGGCREPSFAIFIGTDWNSPESYWLRIRDTKCIAWVAEVAIPDAPKPALGEAIALEAWFQVDEFLPLRGKFFLWTLDGRPLVWVAEAGSAEGLSVPAGLTIFRSSKACVEIDDCGIWSGYDIDVVHPGKYGRVPYGGDVDLGDVRFFHARTDAQTSEYTYCADWFVAWSLAAAVWKAPKDGVN